MRRFVTYPGDIMLTYNASDDNNKENYLNLILRTCMRIRLQLIKGFS